MNLLIISHTAHYWRGDQIVGWGPTVKEIRWLARAFDRVTHIACLHRGPAPQSALPYDSEKVKVVLVPPAGGLDWRAKSRVMLRGPRYLTSILENLPQSDVVHVRCPGSVAMYAIVTLRWVSNKVRWVKYAGNWAERGRMPPSFAFQRWWLRKGLSGGPVTINGRWAGQQEHVFTFDNPSVTLQEICRARRLVHDKTLEAPIRFVFVGRTDKAKGMDTVLRVVQCVLAHRRDVTLDVLGDGPQRPYFERMSQGLGLADHVRFHGWVPHDRVPEHLVRSHFLLLPSVTEGWPKVLSEAMTYGVVPLASDVSAIPQVLDETGAGFALPAGDVSGFVRAIVEILRDPSTWQAMSRAGVEAASRFSYERYLVRLDDMFTSYYGSSPLDGRVVSCLRQQLNASGRQTILSWAGAAQTRR